MQFDAWRGKYKNPFRDLQDDGRSRNWDDERRFRDLGEDGIVAEVVFPNTVPPFFPTGQVIAPAPSADDFELRLAGSAGAQPVAGRLLQRPIPSAAPGSRRSSSTTSTRP